jgi:hypothetical protein
MTTAIYDENQHVLCYFLISKSKDILHKSIAYLSRTTQIWCILETHLSSRVHEGLKGYTWYSWPKYIWVPSLQMLKGQFLNAT